MGLYASGFKTMSKTDMNNYCNRAWKTEFPFLREVDKFALTHSIYDLDAAYKNFFEGRAKFPRFKSKKNPRNSYTTNFTNENISVTGGKNGKGSVKLPKLGSVDAKVHRIPPANWNITGATISKSQAANISCLYSFPFKQKFLRHNWTRTTLLVWTIAVQISMKILMETNPMYHMHTARANVV